MSAPQMLEMPSSALSATGRLRSLRLLSRILTGSAIFLVVALPTVPWQQNIRGTGRVIAYAPLERQQSVDAPIEGRVIHWYVQEGDRVKKGDPIVELSDNDPEILARIRREAEAVQAKVNASDLAATLTEARIQSLEAVREAAISSAKLKVQMSQDRRLAAERSVEASQATFQTADLNLVRQQKLFEKGLSSKRELELAELDYQRSKAEVERAQAALRASQAEVESLSAEQSVVASSNRANIESTQSALEKLKAERAEAQADLAKVEVRLARQEQMKVLAPRDGTILRVVAKQGTEMVKQGETLVLLVPDAESRAVELFIDGNDAPLVDQGRPVRIQFEGWPAVQIVGWPSVAVGTFGGKVAFVDSHDDGQGRFRVVVVPDEHDNWPSTRYLRQGVRANGWALLNRVSIGFELWRQFNGFPPFLEKPQDADSKKEKTP